MANEIQTEAGDTPRETEVWVRGLFMVLFALVWGVAEVVVVGVALLQFGWVVATGRRNTRLCEFGESLGRFFYEMTAFFTFRSDEKPFPFSDWPTETR